jgi:hypothetical protein
VKILIQNLEFTPHSNVWFAMTSLRTFPMAQQS